MKKAWEQKQLGELAELKGRIGWRGLTAKEYTKEGPLFLSVHSLNYGDYVDFRDAFHISKQRYEESPEIMCQKHDVLICKDGAGIGKVGIVGDLPDFTTINSSLLLIRSGKKILPKFLYRCLSSPYFQQIVNARLNGATTPHLYQRDITEFPIVLPPLPEQQRIVAILDEAFAAIAKAKANAEQNLKNAKELFESYLQSVFSNGKLKVENGEWEEKRFEECFKLKSGDGLTSKNMNEDGEYPVFGGNGIAGLHNSFNLSGSNLIIGRVGALCGNVRHITEKIWLTDNAFKVVDYRFDFDHSFLTYLLNHKNLRGFARQAAQPVISNSSLKDVVLEFPKSIKAQQAIVQKLDELSAETKRLEAIYRRKIENLEELKKSVLDKAFKGEL